VRNIVRLTDEYYASRWMPVFNIAMLPFKAFGPERRVICWSQAFGNSPEQSCTLFVAPKPFEIEVYPLLGIDDYEENLRSIHPPDDTDFTSGEFILALLRGMADATADRRFPEVLVMGLHLISRYANLKKPYGAYRIDIWGFLAVAFAGLDLFGQDNAFYCLERIRECCLSISDECHYHATKARVRELLRLDTSSTFRRAVENPHLPKMSEQYVEIVFAHMRSLFRRIEDLMLGFIREYVCHHKCVREREVCFRKAHEIKIAIQETMSELKTLFYHDSHLFATQEDAVRMRMQDYELLIEIMDDMVLNLSRSRKFSNFSMEVLERDVRRFDEVTANGTVDWPTFYVYRKLAYDWVFYKNSLWFETQLAELCERADELVNYQHSRTTADMMTSAFILYVFGRDLEVPDQPEMLSMHIRGSLLDRVQKAMTMVPESFVGLDFRSAILFSIQTLMKNPHLRHLHTKTEDTFWDSWMMDNLAHNSDMAYKNFTYVDRTEHGLSLSEEAHYHKTLGTRVQLNENGDNDIEVEEHEIQRDLRLIQMLRKNNFFLEKAELYGWQQLDIKRRF
jgi:hypothetical protein